MKQHRFRCRRFAFDFTNRVRSAETFCRISVAVRDRGRRATSWRVNEQASASRSIWVDFPDAVVDASIVMNEDAQGRQTRSIRLIRKGVEIADR